jgi:hypothetical protein
MSETQYMPSGLVVSRAITTSQIVTRITSRHDLTGAMRTAWSVLKLKPNAVCSEVHDNEGPVSDYRKLPRAIISREDLVAVQERPS